MTTFFSGRASVCGLLVAIALLAGSCSDGGDGDRTTSAESTAATTSGPERSDGTGEEGGQDDGSQRIALLFVGHGEPTTFADGDVPITFADGSSFGPHGETLGVGLEQQATEWAAAYEEIATAMTYLFDDVNGNGIDRELMVSPEGDVPPFFTWDAFRATLRQTYDSFGDHSPHNELLAEHVASVDVDLEGVVVDTHLAYLDAVPRIPDVMWEIANTYDHDKIVIVPLLLASSTHTQEIVDQVEQVGEMTAGREVVLAAPFYEEPFMRARVKDAVVAMIEHVHDSVPSGVSDEKIGVLLAAHGTPYLPADPELGWQEGDIFSDLSVVESDFHEELALDLPWPVRTGRMNYATPTIEESLAAFEDDGIEHVLVVPSAFPTAAMHTMWDVAEPSVGRAVTPDEGVVVYTRTSGMRVYYTAEGYADLEIGQREFRAGLEFLATSGVTELIGGESGS